MLGSPRMFQQIDPPLTDPPLLTSAKGSHLYPSHANGSERLHRYVRLRGGNKNICAWNSKHGRVQRRAQRMRFTYLPNLIFWDSCPKPWQWGRCNLQKCVGCLQLPSSLNGTATTLREVSNFMVIVPDVTESHVLQVGSFKQKQENLLEGCFRNDSLKEKGTETYWNHNNINTSLPPAECSTTSTPWCDKFASGHLLAGYSICLPSWLLFCFHVCLFTFPFFPVKSHCFCW